MCIPTGTGSPTSAQRAEGAAAAAAASTRAGVRTGLLDSIDELTVAVDLINQTWPGEVSVSTLRAMRKVGNYVGGAFRDDVLVGACVAFFGAAGAPDLHSHLAVVAPEERGSGIGWALKVSQRAWAMKNGVARIQWTFDPMEARNAYVNLAKLSARPVEYLVNFYGDRGDGLEAPFPTDRLLVSWDLAGAPAVAAAQGYGPPPDPSLSAGPVATLLARRSDGTPREGTDHGQPVLLIAAPEDATSMRQNDPALALEWRMLLRKHLGQAVRFGAETIGFTREGFYVVRRAET
jgi:predicted GNAT superfamily acetyltransferase